jgi:xanthosine utilization system XapX-like protein
MAILAFTVGLIGGLFLCLLHLGAGAVWFALCVLVGILSVLDKIQSLLERQVAHQKWFEKLEGHRFEKQFPNAAHEWDEAAKSKSAEASEKTRKLQQRRNDELAAKAEAARKAAEPTFVSRELVPEIPADFKATSDVDFSAFDDVAKPRRKRE